MENLSVLERLPPGKSLGASDWMTIDQPLIDQFAEATGDFQSIHVDPEHAAKTPFGTTIAHGYLSLSLVPKCLFKMFECYELDCNVLNYGSDKVRFLQPVKPGSNLRLHASIKHMDEKANGYLLTIDSSMEIDCEDKPAFIAEILIMLVPS